MSGDQLAQQDANNYQFLFDAHWTNKVTGVAPEKTELGDPAAPTAK